MLKSALLIPFSMLQSMILLLKVKPDIVWGSGATRPGPVVLMARVMGKPTGIVEQNSVAGTTNRILGRFVHRVFIAFDKAADFFPASKVSLLGTQFARGWSSCSPWRLLERSVSVIG